MAKGAQKRSPPRALVALPLARSSQRSEARCEQQEGPKGMAAEGVNLSKYLH